VSATPEIIVLNHITSEQLQRAIDQLPVHYREALLLCEVEEMTYQEIAEVLSIPIGTVMSRLSRAQEAVRAALTATRQMAMAGSVARR
jgi:RNA polymerase sigma-70 factor (ECF subfamily)